jgi:8-oxo-dGTP pyrophosphatase MutT (NUDIX family)
LRDRLSSREPRQAETTGKIQAAVAIVLASGSDGKADLLLIKRAEVEGDPWSGQMAFPGGRREADDADLLVTAQRETQEETGVVLPTEALIGVLDDLAPMTPTLPPIVVRPFVFWLQARSVVTPSHEVALHIWTPLTELPGTLAEVAVSVRGVELTRPAYRAGPHVIWGITHRILSHFFELIG